MWADHDKRSEETNCLNCPVQCNLSFSYKFCNLLEKDEWWNYNSKTMKTYLRRVSIWGMLHGVCTVVYTIFLFQRKMKNVDFHTFLDYLVTKTTKQSIQMKLLSQFSNEISQYIILPDYHANYTVYSFVSHIMSISQISFSKMLLNCSLSSTKLE